MSFHTFVGQDMVTLDLGVVVELMASLRTIMDAAIEGRATVAPCEQI